MKTLTGIMFSVFVSATLASDIRVDWVHDPECGWTLSEWVKDNAKQADFTGRSTTTVEGSLVTECTVTVTFEEGPKPPELQCLWNVTHGKYCREDSVDTLCIVCTPPDGTALQYNSPASERARIDREMELAMQRAEEHEAAIRAEEADRMREEAYLDRIATDVEAQDYDPPNYPDNEPVD